MPQTMFGLLAMIIAMLFAFNQQRTIMHEYDDMVKDEFEIMASGVALEVMENIAGHPFDKSTSHKNFLIVEFDVNKLAAPPFDYDSTYATAAYLEHFNDTETDFEFRAGDTTVPFQVEVDVHYVDESKNPVLVRTDKKEVIVTVYNERYDRYLVQLKRTMSPLVSKK